MTETDTTCRFVVHIDYATKWRDPDQRDREPVSPDGHVFISLINENGVAQTFGYRALCQMLGNENVPEADRIEGYFDGLKPVRADIDNECARPYDEAITYPITRAQYNSMMSVVRDWQDDTPPYRFLVNNCVTFAGVIATAGGIKLPRNVFVIDAPHGLSLGYDVDQAYRRISQGLSDAVERLSQWFDGEPEPELPKRPTTAPYSRLLRASP